MKRWFDFAEGALADGLSYNDAKSTNKVVSKFFKTLTCCLLSHEF
jgi:hypothetical protein